MRALLVFGLVACGRLDFADVDGGAHGDDDGAAVTGDASACTTEICNGIDDDCDGLVDEGCPCTPFSVSYPSQGVQPWLVSVGDGWVTDDGSTFLRIGDDGSLVPKMAGTAIGETDHGTVTWNGAELVSYDAFANHLRFFSVDGAPTHLGGTLDLQMGDYERVSWNGSGFDVASGFSTFAFATTDASGNQLGAAAEMITGPAQRIPLGVVHQNGAAVVVWTDMNQIVETVPSPPDPFVGTLLEPSTGIYGGIATDGHTALFTLADGGGSAFIYTVDTTGPHKVTTLGALDPIDDVGWTGNGWDLVTENGFTNPTLLRRVHLDPSLAITSNDLIETIPHTVSFGDTQATIFSDARRTLIMWSNSVDGAPNTLYLVASCH